MKDNTNKKFWERVSKIYTLFMSKSDVMYDEVCKKLNDCIDKRADVLELACGTGQITYRMADKAKSWIATDYSENMIEEAKKRNSDSHIEFCVADATNLKYENHKFDMVVIANALHIMPNPDMALVEIKRVLKPEGILFAPTFVYEKGYSRLYIWLMERIGFITYHKWNKNELADYVNKYGFEVISNDIIKGRPLTECVLIAKRK